MQERCRGVVADFAASAKVDFPGGQLLGTSGTVTTLASRHLDLPAYDRRKVDGCIVPATAMRDISERLSSQSVSERAARACIGLELFAAPGGKTMQLAAAGAEVTAVEINPKRLVRQTGRAHV